MKKQRKRGTKSDTLDSSSSSGSLIRNHSGTSLHSTGDLAAATDITLEELDSTLHDVLDTILDEVMAKEIVYGEYKARKERINVLELLTVTNRGSSALFPIEVHPSQFPQLVLDRQLLRHIYRNALSNACRYGKQNGIVRTLLKYSETTKTFSMEVTNEPGEGHTELLHLSSDEVASVFTKGTQLKATLKAVNNVARLGGLEKRKESSGNGAWIMQKCAENLHGRCSIKFEPNCTRFFFECPAESLRIGHEVGHQESHSFGLPAGTKCIVIEDSQVQRKLLNRMLQNSGIPSADRTMLGKDSSEIVNSPDRIAKMVKDNPESLFLIIVDENLDVITPGSIDVETVSGSGLVVQLRNQLDPEEESRIISLIRSANDSSKDIDIYLERAHGYLLKEPMKKGNFLDAVKPWWVKRFPDEARIFTEADKHEDEVFGPLPDDIRFLLDQIQSLSSNTDAGVIARRWSVIREKLHVLKGDLKTMSSDPNVLEAIRDLGVLESQTAPEDYDEMWKSLRKRIEDLL
jgi:hypothetical protein